MDALPNRVAREVERGEDSLLYRFENGLEIRTELPLAKDSLRILPLGVPQAALMNWMLCFPERLSGTRVFEPFAGSGAIGLMAAKAGAARVDLLDINPKAVRFQRENAERSRIPADRVACIEGAIESFVPEHPYDWIFANPPFIPTPDGVEGTLTSSGGPDGNRFVDVLLERLEILLQPTGEAFVYLFQFVRDGAPLILGSLRARVPDRDAELTSTQAAPIPAEDYFEAYRKLFPDSGAAIDGWRDALAEGSAAPLEMQHYILHLGPRTGRRPPGLAITDDLESKYGSGLRIPFRDARELAFGRALESYRTS
jgi:hypothetical protein